MDSPDPDARHAPRKRRRTTSGAEAYAARKRAAKACHFCRLRKTKCDNQRPVCGFCRVNGAKCVYDDEEVGENVKDDEQKAILRRLDELKRVVEALASERRGCGGPEAPHEKGGVPHRCECLLQWPIFQAFLSKQERCLRSFVLDADTIATGRRHASNTNDSSSRRALMEEEVVPLVNRFFDDINPRNPILDAVAVKATATRIAEHGFGWGSESCLVLLICALAHYTKRWSPANNAKSPASDISANHEIDQGAASAYYVAAKKRIGLLGDAIIDIQCLFLAHVYEKCALKATQAAYYIQQASLRLQVHMAQSGLSTDGNGLVDRLFWSTVRAESELLPEVGLQPSCLQGLRPTASFPQPPTETTSPLGSSPSTALGIQETEPEQHGWYFYLAEISIRRTLSDMLDLMYEGSPTRWLDDIAVFVRRHAECHHQIIEMQKHLPEGLRSGDVDIPTHELAFFLKGRFVECQVLILRPFLYYVVHGTSSTLHEGATKLAQDCLFCCSQYIRHSSAMNRHGGTWFALRGVFACGMMLVAAVLAFEHLEIPGDWEYLVQSAVNTLNLWGPGVRDIEAMHQVLEKVFLCTRAASQAKNVLT